jgi:hypothetical protein
MFADNVGRDTERLRSVTSLNDQVMRVRLIDIKMLY